MAFESHGFGRGDFAGARARFKRAEELLEGRLRVDKNEIMGILRDHGRDGVPSPLTICARYGSPCRNEYVEFAFS